MAQPSDLAMGVADDGDRGVTPSSPIVGSSGGTIPPLLVIQYDR